MTTGWCSLSNGSHDEHLVMARAALKSADLKRVLIAAHEAGCAPADGSKGADAAARRFADREPA